MLVSYIWDIAEHHCESH